jgi:hypothetical protein
MSSWSSQKSERRAPSDFLKYLQDISTRRFERETRRDDINRERFIAFFVLAVRLERAPGLRARTRASPPSTRASSSAREVAAEAGSEKRCCFSFALRDDSSDSFKFLVFRFSAPKKGQQRTLGDAR